RARADGQSVNVATFARRAEPKLAAYIGLAGLGLIAALVFGLPELVALAAPFALAIAAGLGLSRRPDLTGDVELERALTVEREELNVEVTLTSAGGIERLQLALAPPTGLALVHGPNPPVVAPAP